MKRVIWPGASLQTDVFKKGASWTQIVHLTLCQTQRCLPQFFQEPLCPHFRTLVETNFPHTSNTNQSIIHSETNMKLTTINVLLSLAIVMMAVATELPDTITSAAVTVTVTESVCLGSCAGEATPLSMANALATAADVSAAASLIANMIAARPSGDGEVHRPAANTTTVTTTASASNCPAPPNFDLSPTGRFWSTLDDDLRITANNTDTNGTDAPDQRWSNGRQSLCFTTGSMVLSGYYAIYVDGWGQDMKHCGSGILDNIRGQCGGVEQWECIHWGTGLLMTFWLPAPYRAKCALDGVWLASPHDKREEGLCCTWLGYGIHSNTCQVDG